jgi:uncharacterized protein (DUF983 family)
MRRRALRLRCPWCGVGEMFRGLLTTNERCSGCGLKFEREPGYFLGSIYLNYGVAVVAAFALHFVIADGLRWSTTAELFVIAPVAAALGLLFFRWARALWLAFDLSVDPPQPDEFAPKP